MPYIHWIGAQLLTHHKSTTVVLIHFLFFRTRSSIGFFVTDLDGSVTVPEYQERIRDYLWNDTIATWSASIYDSDIYLDPRESFLGRGYWDADIDIKLDVVNGLDWDEDLSDIASEKYATASATFKNIVSKYIQSNIYQCIHEISIVTQYSSIIVCFC